MINYALQKVKDLQVGPDDIKQRTNVHIFFGKVIWLISTARNIIVVVFCAVLAYVFEIHGVQPFVLTGKRAQKFILFSVLIYLILGYVKPGLPSFELPPFSTQVGNNTYNFIDMASTLGTAVFVVPLFAILENIALAKAFCKS